LLIAIGCAPSEDQPSGILFDNLGSFHREVSTRSIQAQQYFDQGLTLYFGFNHEEAIRSFEQASLLDPECPMAPWGKALALGPNINNPAMDEAASQAAYEAVQRAIELTDNASSAERDLIEALAVRYASPPPEDRSALDAAYADAMRTVWRSHPRDADVGALFAESMMDLRPWDLWTGDGVAQPGTEEIITTLEAVLELAPDHPGANHFYIHAVEASPEPGLGKAAADRLRDLVPGAGHLVHMPSHIDIRTGDYRAAAVANQRAIVADLGYVERVGRHGFYTLYRAHNYHFLAYAAMFEAQREVALRAAREMIDEVPPELVREFPEFLDGFLVAPIHVMVRFGMWQELLEEPAPPSDLPVSTAMWHYGRSVALSSLGRVEESEQEFSALENAIAEVPESYYIGNNTAQVVLEVARPMAEGELEYRRGNYERAFELLREAVRRDDGLRYDEPRGWMQPVRHSLGALLLEQGRVEEAEAVYREDLRINPNNGWALLGLAECLHRSGRHDEAEATDQLVRTAWARSDTNPRVSCFCRTEI
jgi:tetratricopeptide (TPR) repeat protein